MTTTPTAPAPGHQGDGSMRARSGHIGWIVALSLTAGLIAALLLIVAPFIPPREGSVTGAILCGFTVGWALLAVLSARYTDQPQRWAAGPALFMGLGGVLLLVLGSPAHSVLNWVWPPALLALVIWSSFGSAGKLLAEVDGACCTPCSQCHWSPRSAAPTRPSANRPTPPRSRCQVSWSMLADTACTSAAPARAALPSCFNRAEATSPRS